MKKTILVVCIVILFAITIPTIYAYNLDNTQKTVQIVNNASLKSEAKFTLDENVKGIPGEFITISKLNEIDSLGSNQDLVFKITYSVGEVDFIKNILLQDETDLIKDPKSTDKVVTYYGVVKAKELKNLGGLVAEFAIPKENITDYTITVEYSASQQIPQAIEDNLGIKPVDIYASLMN